MTKLLAWIFGIVAAIVLHAAFVLFGGLLLPKATVEGSAPQEVELIEELDKDKEDEKPDERIEEPKEELDPSEEPPPDAEEILKQLDSTPADTTPALDAVSLSSLEAALEGQGGGGEFAESLSFASGGRIGGSGKAGSLDEKIEEAFSISEIDQKPRAVFQSSPMYPSELRGKKIEGVVTVIFVVDPSGKVANPKVEKSSHTAFEGPALSAVKKWKFEPAVRGGERVACKMRVPIRFTPS